MTTIISESISSANQTSVLEISELDLAADKSYSASIQLVGDESAHFKLNTTTGLSPAFGYEFEDKLTSISLSGIGSDIERGLSQIIYTSGQSVNDTFQIVITSDFPENAYLRPGGNFYQYFSSTGSWSDARQAARNSELFGAPGYLTNITTDAENSFIADKVDAKNVWIGGSDEGNEGIWKWMDGPDDEKGKVFWQFDDDTFTYPVVYPQTADQFGSTRNGMFASWSIKNQNQYGVEPNNSGVNGGTWQLGSDQNIGKTNGGGQASPIDNENFIVTNFNGEKGKWNDSRDFNPDKIKGYVVEYEVSEMDDSITVATHTVLDASTSNDPLVNECFFEVGGSGAIELGPGDDRLETNQHISANKLDGQSGKDTLILTNQVTCANSDDLDLENLAANEITIENFETIKLKSGRWAFGGNFKDSDLIISGGSLRLTPSKRNSFALKTSKSGIKIKELDDQVTAKIEVSFENINPNKLPGGRWRIASGINEANFERIEESIITTGLNDEIDDPIFSHKRNSIFAIFSE